MSLFFSINKMWFLVSYLPTFSDDITLFTVFFLKASLTQKSVDQLILPEGSNSDQYCKINNDTSISLDNRPQWSDTATIIIKACPILSRSQYFCWNITQPSQLMHATQRVWQKKINIKDQKTDFIYSTLITTTELL